jgi:hypothetical protein
MTFARVVLGLAILAPAFADATAGQAGVKPPSPADFGQWERLLPAGERGGLSPDGRWLAYAITRTNGENELRVTGVADGTTKAIAFGATPAFSADSRWLAVSVGVSEAQQEKLRKDKKPLRRKLTLVSLASGELATIDNVESFAFSPDGHYLLMRHYAPERPNAARADTEPAATADPEETPGVTVVIRALADGRDTTFGNVGESAWQTKGRLLALTIAAEDRTGNGVQLFDPAPGTLRVLDSAATRYLGLTWRKDADDLVVLKASERAEPVSRANGPGDGVRASERAGESERRNPSVSERAERVSRANGVGDGVPASERAGESEGRSPSVREDGHDGFSYGILAWSGVGTSAEKKHAYDPAADQARKGYERVSAFRRPSWSEDGSVVFVGVGPWPEKAAQPKGEKKDADAADTPTVDVWHPKDVDVMPKQKVGVSRDRQRSLLAAWPLDRPALNTITSTYFENGAPLKSGNRAYVVSWSASALERSWGRFGGEALWLVDAVSGERTHVGDAVDDRFVRASPEGKFILYYNKGRPPVDASRRTDQHHERRADVIRRRRVGFDRRAAPVVRHRGLDGGRSRRVDLRQVRHLEGGGRRLEGGATHRRRRRASPVPLCRSRSAGGVDRSREADLSRDVRRAVEEVRLRAPGAGRRIARTARVARQERDASGEGEGRRRLRVRGSELRGFA